MYPRASDSDETALQRLLAALPSPIRRGYAWLCRPHLAWLRIPAALLLIGGGFLGFLPLLGFWMVPLGVLLLAEDVPALRHPTLRALRAVQDAWDRWRVRHHRS